MKKTFFVVMIALMAIVTAGAQQPERNGRHGRPQMDPEKMVEHRVSMLDKELNLTAEQKQAITAIYTDEAKAMKQNMDKNPREDGKQAKPDREAMKARHEAMKAQQEQVNQKVAAVLTAEQKAKFEQIKDRHPRGGRHDGPGRPPRDGKDGGSKPAAAGCTCDKATAK